MSITKEQPSIHPAVKKLIGKRPREISQTEDFLNSNMCEWKRMTRKKIKRNHALMIPRRRPNQEPKHSSTTLNDDYVKRPCYIPPKIPGNPQDNSSLRGNTSKLHMRVLVGNVARAVEVDVDDAATHKWMVYVRSAPGSLSVDEEVSRVRFFLHPSYKPHDIITVPKPPFTLCRRGWGEFPMRAQLFFKNHLNKTADIIHILKLNGARSGFHTRSAETFADLWIHPAGEHRELPEGNIDGSTQILSLASDILCEDMPDFTSEIRCHKCRKTSTEVEKSCHCSARLNRPDASDFSSDQSDCESRQLTSGDESMSSRAVSRSESDCSSSVSGSRLQPALVETTCSSKTEEVTNEESDLTLELNSVVTSPFFESTNSLESNFKLDPMEFLNLKDSDIFEALEIKQEPPDDYEHASMSENHCPSSVNEAPCKVKSEQETENLSVHNIKLEKEIDLYSDGGRTSPEVKADENSEPLRIKEVQLEVSDELLETEVVYDYHNFGSAADAVSSLSVVTDHEVNASNMDLVSVKSESQIPLITPENIGKSLVLQNHSEVIDLDVVVEDTPISVNDFLESIVDDKQVALNSDSVFNDCLLVDKTSKSNSIDDNKTQKNKKGTHSLLKVSSVNVSNISKKGDSNKKLEFGKKLIDLEDSANSKILQNPTKIQLLTLLKKETPLDKASLNQHDSELVQQNAGINRPIIMQSRRESILLSSTNNPNSLLKPSVQKSIELQKKGQLQHHVGHNQIIQNSNISSKKYCVVLPRLEMNCPRSSLSKNTVIVNGPRITAGPIQRPCSQAKLQNSANVHNILIKNSSSLIINSVPASKTQEAKLKIPSGSVHIKNTVFTTAGIRQPLQSSTFVPNTTVKTPVQNPFVMRSVLNTTNLSPIVSNGLQNKVFNPTQSIKPIVLIKTALSSHFTSTISTSNVQNIFLPCSQTNFHTYSSPVSTTESVNGTESFQPKIINNIIQRRQILQKSEIKNLNNKTLSNSNSTQGLQETKVQENLENITTANRPSYELKKDNLNHSNDALQKASQEKKLIDLNNRLSYSNHTSKERKSEDTSPISICELCKVLRIEYPISKQSSSATYDVTNHYLERTFSCNNTHSNLQSINFLHKKLLFNEKSFMINKERIDSMFNDRMLFYLEQLRVLVNSCRFTLTGSAVRWLVRGLPLTHPDARLDPFKTVHPYCAPSVDAFRAWPPAKQAAALWLRSRTVLLLLSLLQTKGIFTQPIWSTRAIYRWSQLHGYAPAFKLIGPDIPVKNSNKYKDLVNKKTRPENVIAWARVNKNQDSAASEEEVDVTGIESKGSGWAAARSERADGGEPLLFGRSWVVEAAAGVRSAAAAVGARLALEPTAVAEPVTATVLSHLAASFAEDLLRAAFANAFRRVGCSIEACDVHKAILKKPEWDFLTQQGLQIETPTRHSVKKYGL